MQVLYANIEAGLGAQAVTEAKSQVEGDGAESQSKAGPRPEPEGRSALPGPRPALQDVGCVFREQLSSYLNDFGCSISHGQRTVETPRGG